MLSESPRTTTPFAASSVALVASVLASVLASGLVMTGAAAGCGGRIEGEDGSGSASATPAAGSNAPASQLGSEGCARACDRIEACAPGRQQRGPCITSCDEGFRSEQSRAYARCLNELSCAEIDRGLFMDFGPIGECYVRAGGR